MEGKAVGVVSSKLDPLATLVATGDLPQNVNFAIKISYLQALIQSISGAGDSIQEISTTGHTFEALAEQITPSRIGRIKGSFLPGQGAAGSGSGAGWGVWEGSAAGLPGALRWIRRERSNGEGFVNGRGLCTRDRAVLHAWWGHSRPLTRSRR